MHSTCDTLLIRFSHSATATTISMYKVRCAGTPNPASSTYSNAGKEIEVNSVPRYAYSTTLYFDAHHWLILHGRYTCTARKPQCWNCMIADLCDYKDKSPMPAVV